MTTVNTELRDQGLTIEQQEGGSATGYFALLRAERAELLRAAGYPEGLIDNKLDQLQKADQEVINSLPVCAKKHYQSQGSFLDIDSSDGGIELEELQNPSSDDPRQEFDQGFADDEQADGLIALREQGKGIGSVVCRDSELDVITQYGKAVGDNFIGGWEQVAAEQVNEKNTALLTHNTGKVAYGAMVENWQYQSHEGLKAGSQTCVNTDNEFSVGFHEDGLLGLNPPAESLA